MHILVTGGAGYIGSVVVEELVRQGEKVTVLDNLIQGHREAVHPQAQFIQGDLADRQALQDLFAGHSFGAVMHFASHLRVGESMEKPFMYLGET